MSGIRNSPPISISSPRETSTCFPFASAARLSSSAAAQLLTTSASSAPVSAMSIARRGSSACRGRRSRGRPRGRCSRRAASAAAPIARSGTGARPRLVCRITPVALITGVSPVEMLEARPIDRARISSSLAGAGGVPFAPAARARASSRTTVIVRFSNARPKVAAARFAGSDRNSESTDGRARRASFMPPSVSRPAPGRVPAMGGGAASVAG